MSEPFIFMRDFNGLKIPFGVVKIKMADTHFSDFLSKEALCIFNDCSKTYSYLGIYSNSAIDINISDHFIIFFLNIFLGNLHFTTTTTKNPIRHIQRNKTTDQSVHMNNNADKNFNHKYWKNICNHVFKYNETVL